MACVAPTENCFLEYQSCDDDLNVDDFSNIDASLIMSLLEDSRAEDGDDEMLRAMIHSLEPEIMNQDSSSETDNSEFDYRFSDECCSTSPDHHPDFEWFDMEMTGYFAGRFTGNMVEIGGFEEDYSQVCYGMPMEEDDYIGLWQ